jgi:uncharacterized protein YlxW (UPF0749 family)
MKKLAVMMLAGLMLAAVPAFAQTANEKDECVLAAKGCAGEVDSIQKQVHKLQREIQKGDRVYTKEELQTLQRKLEEVNAILNDLHRPGGR